MLVRNSVLARAVYSIRTRIRSLPIQVSLSGQSARINAASSSCRGAFNLVSANPRKENYRGCIHTHTRATVSFRVIAMLRGDASRRNLILLRRYINNTLKYLACSRRNAVVMNFRDIRATRCINNNFNIVPG